MSTAIAYLRISEDPHDRRLGVERQRHDMQSLAERLDTNLERVYEDNDVSASQVRKRDSDWYRALQHVEQMRPNYLLCTAQDRLGRRLADIEGLEDLCRRTGTTVVAYEGGEVFKNPAWPLLAGMAKMEAQATSRRVKAANRVRREKGLPPAGGRRPFGFESDRITLRASEVAVLRDVAERVIGGESLNSLTRWLRESGVATVNGGQWRATSLRQILKNPRYVGDIAEGREEGYRVIGKGTWEPVFDPKTWAALQVVLDERQNHTPGRPRTASLLGGIARCGMCLRPMAAHLSNKRADGTWLRYYRCNKSEGGCARVMIRQERLDERVIEHVLGHPKLFEPADLSTLADLDQRINQAALEQSLLGNRIEEAEAAFREGRVSADVLPLIDRMRADQRALGRQIGEATRDRYRAIAAAPIERFRTGSQEARRLWLKEHGVAVVVQKDGTSEVHVPERRWRAVTQPDQ